MDNKNIIQKKYVIKSDKIKNYVKKKLNFDKNKNKI